MVHPRRTARKSTGRLPVSQLAPRGVPPQQEPQHDSPNYVLQEEKPSEIVVMVPEGQDTHEATEVLPQRKKDKFKIYGVRADVPRMVMVHHQDVSGVMSIRLQDPQWEIHSL
jgi:preprotein translocase subunit SecD